VHGLTLAITKRIIPPVGLFGYFAVWFGGFLGAALLSAITYKFIEYPMIQRGRVLVAQGREKLRKQKAMLVPEAHTAAATSD
jgi:peptidoglycan/LPS O-acetylase OafA/YrhL